MSFDKKGEVLIKKNHTQNKAKALDEELISNSGEDSEEEFDIQGKLKKNKINGKDAKKQDKKKNPSNKIKELKNDKKKKKT